MWINTKSSGKSSAYEEHKPVRRSCMLMEVNLYKYSACVQSTSYSQLVPVDIKNFIHMPLWRNVCDLVSLLY